MSQTRLVIVLMLTSLGSCGDARTEQRGIIPENSSLLVRGAAIQTALTESAKRFCKEHRPVSNTPDDPVATANLRAAFERLRKPNDRNALDPPIAFYSTYGTDLENRDYKTVFGCKNTGGRFYL